jgi:hypothetical protein
MVHSFLRFFVATLTQGAFFLTLATPIMAVFCVLAPWLTLASLRRQPCASLAPWLALASLRRQHDARRGRAGVFTAPDNPELHRQSETQTLHDPVRFRHPLRPIPVGLGRVENLEDNLVRPFARADGDTAHPRVQKLTVHISIRFYHYLVISLHLVASCVKVRKRLIALILKDVQCFQRFAEERQSEFKSHRPDHF